MANYQQMSKAELTAEKAKLQAAYDAYKARGLKLNMARGKPGADQLALSMPMLDVLSSATTCVSPSGVDCRNYGELDGIDEARKLFADLLGLTPAEVIVMGSSSLTIMFDTVSKGITHGYIDSERPWYKEEKVKFLCPVPGYDRHFSITQCFGIEMINVPMNDDGPEMDVVEKLVAEDASIKGIWCVPKYSNPSGDTYSDEVVRRLAGMKTAAKDFHIFWDNAYCVHYVYEDSEVMDILAACKEAGNPNRPFIFASTSKITFPGAGVAVFAASEENIAYFNKILNSQAISWDKLNMLRHVLFFKNVDGIKAQMAKHAAILRPKFDAVLDAFNKELKGLGVGRWISPNGGYFITYFALNGCAKRIVALCKEAGVILTNAGATHPYGKDPDDSAIRIAPSFPSPADLALAIELFCLCVKLASVEKLLAE